MLPELTVKKDCYACGTEPIAANKTGEWRFLTPEESGRLSPCRQGCLLDGEIPGWLEAVKRERWDQAWQIMSRFNPFPALTGYVCFQPCTENCNRGRLDQELDIREVEKNIGRWRLENYRPQASPNHYKGKVAVIGSGPAGLSCAYYLNGAGYAVTVYERASVPGGMLALGIPEYRLPRTVLQQELAVLEQEGISFVTGCSVGRDLPMARLYGQYRRVFLATGAWLARRAGIPGEEGSGVFNALDFLSMVNTGQTPAMDEPVVVIGGGNAAVDSARTALRLNGVNNVTLIYRRGRAEMPANPAEVEAAEREGVEMVFNACPREIADQGQGKKTIVFDRSKTGRKGLIIDSSNPFSKNCGTVIMALGQEIEREVFGFLDEAVRFFAGGDLAGGPATVPEAIRSGRLAALSIQAELEGLAPPALALPEEDPVSFEELNLEARFNLDLQLRQADAVAEAGRCLGCGTCNSCGICYLFCPDVAVDRVNGTYKLNLDYCKGCGICVTECPARALLLEGGRK